MANFDRASLRHARELRVEIRAALRSSIALMDWPVWMSSMPLARFFIQSYVYL